MENASIEHSTSRKASDESFQKYPTSARQNSEQNILSAGRTSSQQQLKDHRTDSSTFSTNSAPVGIGAGKVAALRNRFESYSNGASPATPPPILVAVEDSRKASPGAKSSKHGKDKKKKKSKEASVSISVNSNGTREPEPDKDEFIDSKKKVRRSSIRRPSATGSNAGGGLSEDDLKSLTLDGDEGALPLTRKSSTLSTRQQAALRKTPSFLSRAHTPPPDQLREMKRRQKAESTLSESARSSHRDSLHSSTTNLDSTASTMTPSLNMGTPAAVRASGSASFKKKEKEARKSPTPSNGARSDNSPPPTTAAPIPPPPVKVPPKPSKPAKSGCCEGARGSRDGR
ncbi:hypothetical protein ADEAN_000132700 [Angomonas deanei]|uniref:Uncharacterized protein n=1 Tax=Angomonas deanei TaxID=59799 RepID=A0A7G2C3P2_9TRYP|nr:hypothetical protein ADEAN_000132700 [Angomonas deanei]